MNNQNNYKSKILNVWIDNNFKNSSATPIVYIDVEIVDEKYYKSDKFVTLSLSAWDFSYKVGTNINDEMEKLANAFLMHVGNIININIPPENPKMQKTNIRY